jgi:membrane-associated phospholipid phosphatase
MAVLSLGSLIAYLALSGILLAAGGRAPLAIVHLIGCVLLAMILRARRASLQDSLLPIFVWPFLYFELPALIAAAGTSFHDDLVQRWEAALFHAQPAQVLASHLPWGVLSEVLHAGYLAYYPAIFIPPLVLYARRERTGLDQTVFALGLTYAACWISYVCFPVSGPRYLWPPPVDVPNGFFRRIAAGVLAHGSSRGAAFPSSHAAVAAVQAVLGWRWQPRLFVVLAIVAVAVPLGAVYGGFHYAVDVIAGTVLGVGVGAGVLAATASR